MAAKSAAGLTHLWHNPQLAHQAQIVVAAPMLSHFIIGNTHDMNVAHRNLFESARRTATQIEAGWAEIIGQEKLHQVKEILKELVSELEE